jgi:hypothetical protein
LAAPVRACSSACPQPVKVVVSGAVDPWLGIGTSLVVPQTPPADRLYRWTPSERRTNLAKLAVP